MLSASGIIIVPRAADRERVSLPLSGFTWRVTIPASGLHATASGLLLAAYGVWRVAGDPSRPPYICYIDDILVTGPDDDSHLKNLAEVLDRLLKHNIQIKATNCDFLKPSAWVIGCMLRAYFH